MSSSSAATAPLLHRLEWIPFLLLFLIVLLGTHQCETVHDNAAAASVSTAVIRPALEESEGLWSIQTLVEQHCMADAKILCAAPLQNSSSRCVDDSSVDKSTTETNGNLVLEPSFISILDKYMDPSRMCKMIVPTGQSTSISLLHDEEVLLQVLVNETYAMSVVYFRTKPTTISVPVTDQDAIERLTFAMLTSWWDFFIKGTDDDIEEHHEILEMELNDLAALHLKHSLRMKMHSFPPEMLQTQLQAVIDDYKNGKLEIPKIQNAASPTPDDDAFFFTQFLPLIETFLQHRQHDKESASSSSLVIPNNMDNMRRKDNLPMLHNVDLSDCLMFHYDTYTLITSDCPSTINESLLRIEELKDDLRKRHHIRAIPCYWGWSKGYYFCSWAFVLVILCEVCRVRNVVLRRARQCFVLHALLSLCLWLFSSSCASYFGRATLVPLGGLLLTYVPTKTSEMVEPNDNDDEEIIWRSESSPSGDENSGVSTCEKTYELPLLGSSSSDSEGQDSKIPTV